MPRPYFLLSSRLYFYFDFGLPQSSICKEQASQGPKGQHN